MKVVWLFIFINNKSDPFNSSRRFYAKKNTAYWLQSIRYTIINNKYLSWSFLKIPRIFFTRENIFLYTSNVSWSSRISNWSWKDYWKQRYFIGKSYYRKSIFYEILFIVIFLNEIALYFQLNFCLSNTYIYLEYIFIHYEKIGKAKFYEISRIFDVSLEIFLES